MIEESDVTSGGDTPAETTPPESASATTPHTTDDATKALVKRWCEWVKKAKAHWKPQFDRMDDNMRLVEEGTDDETWSKSDKYVVPVINRHINTAVATLYAKNPKAIAKRKKKLLYTIWDGTQESLAAAIAGSQPQPVIDPATGQPAIAPDGLPMLQMDPMTGQPLIDPNAVAIVNEVAAARQQILMYERLGQTLGLLFEYYMNEQDSGYKEEIKALVKRAKVCHVGYVVLDFQRRLGKNPDKTAAIADSTSQLQALEGMLAEAKEEGVEEDSAEAAELKLLIETLQSEETIILREGPVLSFPASTEVIPDKGLRNLKTFSGCRWVAQEFDMDEDEVRETFGVNLQGQAYTHYAEGGSQLESGERARLWRVWDKKLKQVFVVCDGYCDFIDPPAAPKVQIERFWPIFPLVFNQSSNVKKPFGNSDAWNARHMQREYNQSREARREHRRSALPRYITGKDRLEEKDKAALASAEPHTVVEIMIPPDMKATDIIQRVPTVPIDESLYETGTIFADIQRVVGSQEANLGGTSGATATESSIAENSRLTTSGDNTDDLDTMLTALARAMGQLMLMNLDKQTVIEIAGPGAVWPDMPPTREEIAKDLFLEVQAGSSGRPNAAVEVANLERAMPHLVLIPGINPEPIVKKYADALEIDMEDLYVQGAPSITATNQMAGAPMPMGADPNAQGPQGANNSERPAENEPGGQPAFPAPSADQPNMGMAA